MTVFLRITLAALLLLTAAIVSGPAAFAGDPEIDAAQRQGVIGERIDGYLGVVDGSVDPALLRKVNEINNKRRALYDETARRTGTTTAQVARVTGEKPIEKAQAGEFIMTDDGRWTKK